MIRTAIRYTVQYEEDGILNAPSSADSETSLIDIPYFSYTGKAITPVIHLYNGSELLDNKSYSISYKNNTKASCPAPMTDGDTWAPLKTLPQIVINLKGNFSGTKILYFNIYPLDLSNGENCSAADIIVIGTNKNQKISRIKY